MHEQTDPFELGSNPSIDRNCFVDTIENGPFQVVPSVALVGKEGTKAAWLRGIAQIVAEATFCGMPLLEHAYSPSQPAEDLGRPVSVPL